MVTLDTNVILRLVYRDDAAQAERAAAVWRDAAASDGIFLTTTVLVELAWVLRVAAKFDRSAIASAIHRLCNTQAVTVEHESRVRQALERYRAGPADLSDYLILEAAREAQALPVLTFDERFAKSDGASLIEPQQTP